MVGPGPGGGRDRVRRYRAVDRVDIRASTDMNDRMPTREGFGHRCAMSRLALTFACCRYDRMDAIRDWDVLNVFERTSRHPEQKKGARRGAR